MREVRKPMPTDPRGEPRQPFRQPRRSEILKTALPELGLFDRTLTKALCCFVLPRFNELRGLENVRADLEPFVLALNHCTRFEALALPAALMYHRGGRRVHFLADWNFQMIPGVGLLYRRSGAIVVTRKSARPRVLNVLKPLYAHRDPPHVRAIAHLRAGRSVGIYLEGTVNSDPSRLLRGRLGAARLSLEARVPVVPGGIKIVGGSAQNPILDVMFGAPMQPPVQTSKSVTRGEVRSWHSTIMTEIARLSGKAWEPQSQEPCHETA